MPNHGLTSLSINSSDDEIHNVEMAVGEQMAEVPKEILEAFLTQAGIIAQLPIEVIHSKVRTWPAGNIHAMLRMALMGATLEQVRRLKDLKERHDDDGDSRADDWVTAPDR